MDLKMYEFDGDVKVWVCAEDETQAIAMFKQWHGEDVFQDLLDSYSEETVREMSPDEMFTYYHDGSTSDEDSIGNHIKKYCKKPDMFASSIY